MDADGNWRTLAGSPTVTQRPTPGFMGKAAMRELKARGVDYIYLRDSDYGGPEVLENPEAWGLTPILRIEGGQLYRIDAGLPILEPGPPESPKKGTDARLFPRR